MMQKLFIGLLAFTLVLAASVQAAPEQPREIVKQTSNQVMDIIDKRGKELEKHPKDVNQLVNKIILPAIDFDAFSKLVLGKYWRTASAEQRKRFQKALRHSIVDTYITSLSDYAGAQIKVLPARGSQGDQYRTVYTRIASGEGKAPIGVNWSFRFNDGQWKAYDVVIDGLSMVKNFRTSFTNEIDKNGLDSLINRLEGGGKGLINEPAKRANSR